ncbi:hypothetical protein [Nevskia sp.]|uniref:hypothetical protein n=1 Tax=Nevskia sp. TaxID=1929292 RepID=UPI0025D09F4A|nr:hypothetical protein [Nevskia sp.]
MKALCAKFYDDLQAVFDDPAMDDATYSAAICTAAVSAQGYADDARNAELDS